MALSKLLARQLSEYRRCRQFDAQRYLSRKAWSLNDYFKRSGIQAAIVGVSGGVDSAVVAGILAHTIRQPGSPLKKVVGVLLPITNCVGATSQEAATEKGRSVIEKFSIEDACADLGNSVAELKLVCDRALGTPGRPWSCGQLASYIRTPALYYLSSLLTEQGNPAVVCGTTNRDEGSYIGFFGKASDAMVDLQVISDIHKSEVYRLADLLGVPESVIQAEPSGDVYDGRVDVEMIGAPYDAVELYIHLRCDSTEKQHAFEAGLDNESGAEFKRHRDAIEAIHAKNAHKYLGDSPAVHLDVFERAVPGGWRGPTLEKRFAAQLRSDPIYRAALPLLRDYESLMTAGLFLETEIDTDRAITEVDLRWYTTPLNHVRRNFERTKASGRPKAILVTTGALCPVHEGHLHMMTTAHAAVINAGYDVLGGFFSPSHDEYVALKCGSTALPAGHRLDLCRQACEESGWLTVDSWESLYAGRDVNFTRTCWRLKETMHRFFPEASIEVFYVCGGDNARFALSFVGSGGCVVVPRDSSCRERIQQIAAHPFVADNPRIIMLESVPLHAASSSAIRKGDTTHLGANYGQSWKEWSAATAPNSTRSARVKLRDEGERLTSIWDTLATQHKLSEARTIFVAALCDALDLAFSRTSSPDLNCRLHVTKLSLDEQIKKFGEYTSAPTISLDPFFPGEFNIGCSRYYELGASWIFHGIHARPGCPPLDEQIDSIPPGKYTLFDDDSATGSTIQAIKRISAEKFEIRSVTCLSDIITVQQSTGSDDIFDLGDIRDFLPGARNGGLVVLLPRGGTGRVPYLLPYVQPHQRLSMPISSEILFSKTMWLRAAEFFDIIKVRLDETEPSFAKAMESLGWHGGVSMADLCRWHLDQFSFTSYER